MTLFIIVRDDAAILQGHWTPRCKHGIILFVKWWTDGWAHCKQPEPVITKPLTHYQRVIGKQ